MLSNNQEDIAQYKAALTRLQLFIIIMSISRQYFDKSFFLKHLINKSMFRVYSS